MAEICVVGAGPAGCVFAARMTQLGHDVQLIERERFPRRHLGESLSPGVMPLLRSADLQESVEAAGFPRIPAVLVKWGGEARFREDPRDQGLLVDRGEFDLRLLTRAQSLGVRVRQPARLLECRPSGSRWRLRIESERRETTLDVDLLADARGRRGAANLRRGRTGAPTLAVYAYWRGRGLPRTPRIEAGRDAWYWGVPLPDGTCNTLAFVDPKRFRSAPGASASERFFRLLDRSGLLDNRAGLELIGPVQAIDATPYLERECATPNVIRIGDAALAVDPISSSGVQRAIQSALSGAVVANTLMRKPESTDAALGFYRANLIETSERHRRWAAGRYRAVACQYDDPFWTERSAQFAAETPPPRRAIDAKAIAAMPVELSEDVDIIRTPCLDGEFVSLDWAVRHPGLASPVAYLDGWALAPLVRKVFPGSTPLEIAQSWSNQVPLRSGLAIVAWLFNRGVLIGSTNQSEAR